MNSVSGQPMLKRMAHALEQGQPVPPDVATWFLASIRAFEDSQEDLAELLSIKPTRALRRARNEHLREAGRLIGETVPATVRATMIRRAAAKLSDFLGEPQMIEPYIANSWELHVFRAIQCADLPSHSTIRQLMP